MEKLIFLVNNAGGGGAGRESIESLTLEYITKTYTLNLFSGLILTKLCAPHMKLIVMAQLSISALCQLIWLATI